MKKNTNESNLIRRSHGVRPTSSPGGRLYKREGSRRGFTIVELVVTLTIIVLVSAISIGVVAVNNKTYGETIDMIEATNIAENAVECFRYAANNTNDNDARINSFETTFKRSLGLSDDASIPKEENEGKIIYTVAKDDLKVVVEIDNNTITVFASSETDDNLFEGPVIYTVR